MNTLPAILFEYSYQQNRGVKLQYHITVNFHSSYQTLQYDTCTGCVHSTGHKFGNPQTQTSDSNKQMENSRETDLINLIEIGQTWHILKLKIEGYEWDSCSSGTQKAYNK